MQIARHIRVTNVFALNAACIIMCPQLFFERSFFMGITVFLVDVSMMTYEILVLVWNGDRLNKLCCHNVEV